LNIISRSDVIRNAEQYRNIQPWTPTNDTHGNFHSAFVRGVEDPVKQESRMRQYDVFPYVYGRTSILTVNQFLNAVQHGTCPGGWDTQTGWGTGHFANIRRNLAGIDCSEYVMKSWGFASKVINGTWYGTANLPQLCLQIYRDELDTGDILLRRGHVRIFDRWAGPGRNNAWIYEAAGARDETQAQRNALQRPFNPGDDQGCVGRWMRPWDAGYTPYSPFPQFTDPEPAINFQESRPPISVKIAGSGDIGGISMSINDSPVSFSPSSVYDRNRRRACVQINWVPNQSLSYGTHTVKVGATNRILEKCFFAEYTWKFEIV